VPALKLSTFVVRVTDPELGVSEVFRIEASRPEHAERQAKDGFTGLLGDVKAAQARLVCETQRLSSPLPG
jgi:hypothetical protein